MAHPLLLYFSVTSSIDIYQVRFWFNFVIVYAFYAHPITIEYYYFEIMAIQLNYFDLTFGQSAFSKPFQDTIFFIF